MEGKCDLGLQVGLRAEMLSEPLQRDNSYKDSGEAEDKTEEPQYVDADSTVRRSERGQSETLRDGCSVCAAFKLGKDTEQENVSDLARVLPESLVGLDDESSDDC